MLDGDWSSDVCSSDLKTVSSVPVTVKCRIGVDEQDPEIALDTLADKVFAAGADALWVHARKAWLKGLSPRENREIPPLDYDRAYRLKKRFPSRFIGLNGGIADLDQAVEHLSHMDGVMLGSAAWHNAALLGEVDHRVYGEPAQSIDWNHVRDRMMDYAENWLAGGGRLNAVTKPMLGLFAGVDGARRYRQILSTDAVRPGAGPEVIARAFEEVIGATARGADLGVTAVA
jgi:tRNA-dihydrouridine synthase A